MNNFYLDYEIKSALDNIKPILGDINYNLKCDSEEGIVSIYFYLRGDTLHKHYTFEELKYSKIPFKHLLYNNLIKYFKEEIIWVIKKYHYYYYY